MILKMQKLTLIGFLADKEALLKDLMRKKCVQIEGPENIQDYESISAITVPGVAQTYELEQEQTKFTSAIRALSPYEEKGGLFAKKERADFSAMFDKSLYQEACQLRDGVNEIVKQIADHKTPSPACSCRSPRWSPGRGWIWISRLAGRSPASFCI